MLVTFNIRLDEIPSNGLLESPNQWSPTVYVVGNILSLRASALSRLSFLCPQCKNE